MTPILNVISLVERQDRRDILLNQLIGYKVPYNIWYGMVVEAQPYRGIAKSHKQIVEFAKNTGMPYVIIGEDDLLLTSRKSWQHYLDNMPEEFDIYLGTISGGEIDKEKKEPVNIWSGLMLYTVHARFYDAFLKADEGVHLDRYFSGVGKDETERRLGRKPVYKVCYPIVATCFDGFSDNSKKEMKHENCFIAYQKYKG